MKKTLAVFIIVLFAVLTACAKRPYPDVIDIGVDETEAAQTQGAPNVVTAIPSADPSAAPSAEPTEAPTPAPTEAFIPSSVEEAIARYEAYPLDYEPVEREDVKPNRPITEPRYKMGADGIYYSSASTGDNEATIMMTGDLMCQTRQQEAAKNGDSYDFNGSFDFVRGLFGKVDLVVGNLEATLTPTSPYMAEMIEVEERPHLNSPASFLEAIRYAGYDLVVMSNNHNCDTGVRGVYDTLDRVDEYKLVHTGLYRNLNETRYVVMNVEGINVGFMSYATYFNTKEAHFTQEGRDVLLNAYSKERLERDMAAVRAAGAEYVIVYIHWGVEYSNEPEEQQIIWAQELADAGVDYIIGSHPHALQPYDILTASDGRQVPIVYSMGNFVSHQKKVVTKDTIILRIILKRDENGKVYLAKEGYVPGRVFLTFAGRDYAVVPITSPYNGGYSSGYFAPAYERITGVIGPKIAIMGEL
ncbi:MAG: CapA family protein [Clostridia bacterium]|nr:CapA family protein [Clostridia bacterium]